MYTIPFAQQCMHLHTPMMSMLFLCAYAMHANIDYYYWGWAVVNVKSMERDALWWQNVCFASIHHYFKKHQTHANEFVYHGATLKFDSHWNYQASIVDLSVCNVLPLLSVCSRIVSFNYYFNIRCAYSTSASSYVGYC